MDAITLPYVISVLATVLVGRLISFTMKKHFRDKDTEFMNFEILTRIPLFLLYFVSAAFALHTPAIHLGALNIESFAPAALLTYPVALFLGMANARYGVLKPIDPKDINADTAIGLSLIHI